MNKLYLQYKKGNKKLTRYYDRAQKRGAIYRKYSLTNFSQLFDIFIDYRAQKKAATTLITIGYYGCISEISFCTFFCAAVDTRKS